MVVETLFDHEPDETVGRDDRDTWISGLDDLMDVMWMRFLEGQPDLLLGSGEPPFVHPLLVSSDQVEDPLDVRGFEIGATVFNLEEPGLGSACFPSTHARS